MRDTRRLGLLAAILASSMAFVDSSVLAIAIPALRIDLGASLAEALWVSNAYALFVGALILLGGAAGDSFGVRPVFAASIAGFVILSALCALAPNAPLLIAARAGQGIAAAFMIPCSLALIAAIYPREERGGAIGLWAAASSVTTILGPIIGGFLLTGLGESAWRLVFAINLPLGGLALVLLRGIDNPSRTTNGRRLDWRGAALASLGLGLFAYGLTGTGEGGPDVSHLTLFCLAGIVVLAGFIVWQHRTSEPMMPLRLFANRTFAGANLVTLCLYFAMSGVMFFVPMALIGGWGASPADVAIAFLPFGAAMTVLSPISGKLADRVGPAPLVAIGATTTAFAYALMGLTAPYEAIWTMLTPLIGLMGLGMGLVVSPLSTAVMTSVTDDETGLASGVNNAVSRVSSLLAIAVLGLVATQGFERALGPGAELALFFGLVPTEPLPVEIDMLRKGASNAALALVAYVCAILCAIAAAIALATQAWRRR